MSHKLFEGKSVFHEGYEAHFLFRFCGTAKNCPYADNANLSNEWMRGWNEADRKCNEEANKPGNPKQLLVEAD